MPEITETAIRKALSRVIDPAHGKDIVTLNHVSGIAIKDDIGGSHIFFSLEVDPARGPVLEDIRQHAENAVKQIAGVSMVTAVLTAHRGASKQAMGKGPPRASTQAAVPGIKHIVAVASGKGGVGKSTMAVNLAAAFAADNLRVGLMDADIYGPSVPRMLGIADKKPEMLEGKKLQPIHAAGMQVMSMGFLVAEDNPVIWRGPMVMGAIQQFLRDVAWGELDILVVDMPPGTGDAQLTLAQQVPLSGAVIVTTPQDISLIDARKGLNMFRRVDVPILGLVENMSYFICPHCSGRSEIFSHGGGRSEAGKLECDFLGEVPLDLEVRQSMDAGKPIVVANPNGTQAMVFKNIAARILKKLNEGAKVVAE
ncbi:MAG: iron-sulfur cluster carrier protein ApbC [Alphaproteobacteria bacterium]